MKAAIVVTGASSGIGRELARVAARRGSAMLLVGQSQTALDELAAELTASGAETHPLALDLADRQAGDRIESALFARDLYCDVLVNSAGFGLYGAAAELDRAEQIKLLDVNARALTELTLRFLPGMLQRRRGGVLNVGSITGYMPGPRMALYFATKAYVRSFSASLSAEVAGSGVTVTCLAPGVVRTAFFERCKVGHTRMFKIAPRGDAAAVATAGWRAFKAGKRLVTPRLIDRIIIAVSAVVPDGLLLRFMAALQPPR
jgi:short-subunit dehydrogenase